MNIKRCIHIHIDILLLFHNLQICPSFWGIGSMNPSKFGSMTLTTRAPLPVTDEKTAKT